MTDTIDPERMPRHIAIVMDGNRRWAKSKSLPRLEGHRQGVKAVRRTVKACISLKVPTLTLYTFSSENWNRPPDEVSALMDLLAYHLRKEMEELAEEGVRFRALGRIHELSSGIRNLIADMEEKTRYNDTLNFNLAINYGGRQEMSDATRGLVQDALAGRIKEEDITESTISARLTTAGQPDPDLLIRTGGEQRISNFLLWQLAYTELVFLPIFWPAFSKRDLEEAIWEYSQRDRRFGATN
ncbi:MAG: di-trans,poly-cis-decaprenylcistransferase [Magnetococcales bacterium]|nr:di-trans,poly-cis-decaprenylcistransferase [Magnetococcales bacterium]